MVDSVLMVRAQPILILVLLQHAEVCDRHDLLRPVKASQRLNSPSDSVEDSGSLSSCILPRVSSVQSIGAE